LTVTVVNTKSLNYSVGWSTTAVSEGYRVTVTVKREECQDPTTITFTAITFADPFISVNPGASLTGTFADSGYTKGANTASEVCGPRTYAIEESGATSTWVTFAAPASPGVTSTYTVTADATS